MPDVTVTLTDQEYADLKSIAEEELKEVDVCAHDLLVTAISERMDNLPAARARVRAKGVSAERRRASFVEGAVAALKRSNLSTYPRSEQRKL